MIIINTDAYFGPHAPAASDHFANAKHLLAAVNALLMDAPPYVSLVINPATATLVSGQKFGGYRPQSCPIGAPNSAHKTGEAVDVYDPRGEMDAWLTDDILAKHGLYREHPSFTVGWCHLSTRAPRSGNRTFYP